MEDSERFAQTANVNLRFKTRKVEDEAAAPRDWHGNG